MQATRKRLIASACLFLGASFSGYAQQSRTVLSAFNNLYIVPNGHAAVTGSLLNTFNNNMIGSAGMLVDANAWTGANTWAGASTFSSNPIFSSCTGFISGAGSSPATCGSINSLSFNGKPWASSPTASPSGFGTITIVGTNAGLNVAASSIDSTFLGDNAGGSGATVSSGCAAGGGTGMTGLENTAIGWHALTLMVSGNYNTAVGVNSMGCDNTGSLTTALGVDAYRNSKGNSNSIGVGYSAMRNVNGAYNIAIGNLALSNYDQITDASIAGPNNNIAVGYGSMGGASITASAQFDTFVGHNSGGAITTATRTTGVGMNVLTGITTQNDNVAVGYEALQTSVGAGNTAVGTFAMQAGSGNGSNNTAIGFNSGNHITTGSRNAALGYNSASAVTTNGDVTALGYQALQSNTGPGNTAVGASALSAGSSSGGGNTAVGFNAGALVTAGVNNTILGEQAGGATLTTGSGNVLIGAAVDTIAAGTNNELNVGGVVFQNLTTGAPTIAGGTSPSADAHANMRSGTVTFGSGALASGTITFATAYASWAHCRVTPHATLASFGYSYTTGVITVTATSLTSAVVDYECDGV